MLSPFSESEVTMSWNVRLTAAKGWYCNIMRKRHQLRLKEKKQRDAAAEEKRTSGLG